MAKSGYSVATGAAVLLATGVARTVLAVNSPAQFGVDLKKIRVGFTGVSATEAPVLVELMYSTQATNSTPGTNNTTATVNQIYGRTITAGFTAFYASAATFEPTVLTLIDSFLLDPNKGLVVYDFPLGDTPDTAVSNGMVLRCTWTGTTAPSVRASMLFERT